MTARMTTAKNANRDATLDQLVARREAVLRSIESLHGEAADAMEHRDLSDLYDIETVADVDVGITLSLATTAERSLAKLDAAIARVADGNYGRCIACGEEITTERLGALPMTSRCIRCSRKDSMVGPS